MDHVITRVPGAKICMTNQGIKRIPLTNADDSGGHWVTTDDGNRLFITEGGEVKTGPSGKTVDYTKDSPAGQLKEQYKSGSHMPASSYEHPATPQEISAKGSAGSVHGTISTEEPITIKNEKHASSGGNWRNVGVEATEMGPGHIDLHSPTDMKYDNPNRNTVTTESKISAGLYTTNSKQSDFHSHNLNWDKISRVSGSTFGVKEFLKEKGFRFEGSTKNWVK